MRRNETDRRPVTLHISVALFWSLITLAAALPVLGFLASVGWIAPAWLKMDFNSMRHQVELAEKTKLEGEAAKADLTVIQAKLDGERKARAEAETKATMSETARTEATTKLTTMETELLAMKQSLATYEQLLKPKLERELLQCVGLTASAEGNNVSYSLSFAKISQTTKLPDGLTARVRVIAGDNAMAMSASSGGKVVNHQLDVKKELMVKGTLQAEIPPNTTRLVDVKVFDKNAKPVGYCWKTF
jgi:hypothetical protein